MENGAQLVDNKPTITAKKKNNVFCSVYGCNSNARNDVYFHFFPKKGANFVKVENKFGNFEKIDRREAWIRVLRIGKEVSPYMRICSLHFTPEDYCQNFKDTEKKKHFLKSIAVPSCNLPKTSSMPEKSVLQRTSRSLRRAKRTLTREHASKTAGGKVLDKVDHVEPNVTNETVPMKSREIYELLPDEQESVIQELQQGRYQAVHVGIQTDFSFYNSIRTDRELSTLTGIMNFTIFETIVRVVTNVVPKIDQVSKVPVRDKIVMTYMKLKHNLSYAIIAALFKNCSQNTCKNAIYRMLDILSSCLTFAVPWPSREEIKKNIPICFKNFKDVRAVIDCTEIPIQKPKKLCCQINHYSHYKGTFTVKVMTCVTPGGNISYVSEPYGGRASDKAIFQQSNLIKLLEKGDALMTDKGFFIDDLCSKYEIKLVRPPFLRKKKQFSETEAQANQEIASARVHIERSNQRIKDFKILSSKFPSGLVKKVDQIFFVICATVNLGNSILRDDKFHE